LNEQELSIPKYILPVIVVAQFCCTSLWFAGNGIMQQLIETYGLVTSAVGHLTSAVQFGFIVGTLLFAILTIADRFSPSKVFFFCALLGAGVNLGILFEENTFTSLIVIRFLIGFFLAGIYPVGMKIASDYFDKGLGKSLGFLVGALVLGTAIPHFLKGSGIIPNWEMVIYCTSGLAALGGILIAALVADGPHRSAGKQFDLTAFVLVFKKMKFRQAAFGYFGHMWELYSFWTFVPIILLTYNKLHPHAGFNISILSFFIIAIGALSCFASGYIAEKIGPKKTASMALQLSCICCLISPFAFTQLGSTSFLFFLLFWGTVVIADSPMFSTLVAQNADPEIKGTALTIVNCIGFFLTIISILTLTYFYEALDSHYIYSILAIGPIIGILSLTGKE